VFDEYDAAHFGRAIEFRHPLLDLRLIRFALGLPAVPWCVDKHLLRACLGELPAELRRRPKTPLAADPVAVLVQHAGLASLRAPAPSRELDRFVDARALPDALREAASGAARGRLDPWPLLRAVALGAWLEHRDEARPVPNRRPAANTVDVKLAPPV
jgi:hypothetical protein